MSLKVLFLDFDGVLNSRKYLRNFNGYGVAIDSERMRLLKGIIDATEAKIVLTTSWRVHWDKDTEACKETGKKINDIFNEYDLKIYDKTSVLGTDRESEIRAWLEEHFETENFAVLDDMFLDADFLRGHFVRTSDYKDGLDEETSAQAVRILNAEERGL